MRVFYPYGSKERLFEMLQRVNKFKINEEKLSNEKRNELTKEFIKFLDEKLKLNGDLPKIIISYDSKEAQNMKSFGKYTPETNETRVVFANRNLADDYRTLAHEIIHNKQRIEGKLQQNSNKTGSEDENEANALAGVLMREFGEKHPEIFE